MRTKPRDILIAAGVCLLLVGGIAFDMLFTAVRVSRPAWPPVSDPGALLMECAALLEHPGPVQEPNWPTSIRSLEPRYVTAEQDYVEVTISTGGINPAYGYLVYPDRRSKTTARRGLLIHGFVCPGLFTYETDE